MNVQLRWLETDEWVPQLCQFRHVLQYRVYGIQPDGSKLPSWGEWQDVPIGHDPGQEAALAAADKAPGLKFDRTRLDRGFAYIQFNDLYGASCSIQKSSLATDDAIWLGCNDVGLKHDATGLRVAPRMHLNQRQVAELLPILRHFVDTGEIDDA